MLRIKIRMPACHPQAEKSRISKDNLKPKRENRILLIKLRVAQDSWKLEATDCLIQSAASSSIEVLANPDNKTNSK